MFLLFLLLHCCNSRFLLVQTEDKNEMSVEDDHDGTFGEHVGGTQEETVDELPDDLKLLTDSLETENGRGNSDYYYCENNFCT